MPGTAPEPVFQQRAAQTLRPIRRKCRAALASIKGVSRPGPDGAVASQRSHRCIHAARQGRRKQEHGTQVRSEETAYESAAILCTGLRQSRSRLSETNRPLSSGSLGNRFAASQCVAGEPEADGRAGRLSATVLPRVSITATSPCTMRSTAVPAGRRISRSLTRMLFIVAYRRACSLSCQRPAESVIE